MPVVSKAQNRYVRWAAEHPTQSGMKSSVSHEFIASMHGKSLKGLPEHVPHKASGGTLQYDPRHSQAQQFRAAETDAERMEKVPPHVLDDMRMDRQLGNMQADMRDPFWSPEMHRGGRAKAPTVSGTYPKPFRW